MRMLAKAAVIGSLLTPAGAFPCDPHEGLYGRLMRHEGVRECVYEDQFGNPTIGIGHLLSRPVERGTCWDHEQVLRTFHSDVHSAQHSAQHAVPNWHLLTTVQREVFSELAFQIGEAGLRRFHRMLRDVAKKDFDGAADELLRSRLATQAPARTRELACLLRG